MLYFLHPGVCEAPRDINVLTGVGGDGGYARLSAEGLCNHSIFLVTANFFADVLQGHQWSSVSTRACAIRLKTNIQTIKCAMIHRGKRGEIICGEKCWSGYVITRRLIRAYYVSVMSTCESVGENN